MRDTITFSLYRSNYYSILALVGFMKRVGRLVLNSTALNINALQNHLQMTSPYTAIYPTRL